MSWTRWMRLSRTSGWLASTQGFHVGALEAPIKDGELLFRQPTCRYRQHDASKQCHAWYNSSTKGVVCFARIRGFWRILLQAASTLYTRCKKWSLDDDQAFIGIRSIAADILYGKGIWHREKSQYAISINMK